MTQAMSVLEARGLCRRYVRAGHAVTPVDGADLTLRAGETDAVVGPSGAGKSTLARLMTLLEPPDAGSLRLRTGDGWTDPWKANSKDLRALRRRCQLLPQDPVRAVSPRWTVGQVVAEPLLDGNRAEHDDRHRRVAELLAKVELDVPLDRRARDLSGGQLQRLVLARALACEPRVMVLDESLTGLDLPLRARLLELLRRVQSEATSSESGGLALLLISHDVELMRRVAHRVWRLDDGRLLPLEGTGEATSDDETAGPDP